MFFCECPNAHVFSVILSYIIPLTTFPILVRLRPVVLGTSICIIINFSSSYLEKRLLHHEIYYGAEARTKIRWPNAHEKWTCGHGKCIFSTLSVCFVIVTSLCFRTR